MNKLMKTIEYRNKKYLVKYNYMVEKRIDGNTTHVISILEMVNGEPLIIYNHSCTVTNGMQISIIGLCREAIDKYEDGIRPQFSSIDEFNKWDGRLDNWDE